MKSKTTQALTTEAALFPIGTVSEQTGVNTVTLRAWERRYGLLKPQRTPKGHRLYAQHDVERVQQVLILLEQGIPVSRVRDVLDKQNPITHLWVATDVQTDDPWQHYRAVFLRCIHKMDARALEQAFNEALALYALTLVNKKLLQPLYQQLAQQAAYLPATAADFAFLHEFLCARLSSLYLQHLSHSTGKRLLLVNMQAAAQQITSLLLANTLAQHGYQISLLAGQMRIDHLPLVLERTHFEAMLVVGAENLAPLDILATLYQLPVFITDTPTEMVENTRLYVLPQELADICAALDAQLGMPIA